MKGKIDKVIYKYINCIISILDMIDIYVDKVWVGNVLSELYICKLKVIIYICIILR